eukprot:TRINITY_DN11442_c0_g1_i1.p1 TRINITY_DN11442_c0_g1~~TRINITY_DN11442_c0_g1_i1.p1  ORF type:complete len:263 (+),score=92.47 TRINITY_DN11442_c0_g1_i1:55-843(+)
MPGSAAMATQDLVARVCAIVENVAAANEAHSKVHHSRDPRAFFDCIEVPALTFTDYAAQLTPLKFDAVWPLALILADRLCRKADCTFNPHQVHRLMLTAYCIACKLSYDLRGLSCPTAYRGSVGLEDLHRMERTFLSCCDWEVTVTPEEYYNVVDNIEQLQAAAESAAQRPGAPVHLIPDDFAAAPGSPMSAASSSGAFSMAKSFIPCPPEVPRDGVKSEGRCRLAEGIQSSSQQERPRCCARMDKAKQFASSCQGPSAPGL